MRAFSELLDNLNCTPQRNGRIRLLINYFEKEQDPNRGWAVAILTGGLELPNAKTSVIRRLISARTDQKLFELSYEYVGDLAETVSLLWPNTGNNKTHLNLTNVIRDLQIANRKTFYDLVGNTLDKIDTSERFAFLKLIMGNLRVGVSARLVKLALAEYGNKQPSEIEELWFGLKPPYQELFAWLEAKAPPPIINDKLIFRPLMLANPITKDALMDLKHQDFVAEWKWDGIRAILVGDGKECKLYSRTGDDIGQAFPDIVRVKKFRGVVDGELLVVREGVVAPFNDLQKRLGRKKPSKKLLEEYPAHFRVYDMLFNHDIDLRSKSLIDRRTKLKHWVDAIASTQIDFSSQINFSNWEELSAIRDRARANGIEGLMLKQINSPYLPGRPKGPWFKWKRDPLVADCVLMYAQRGHGKRSSFYSDYTFGCWRNTVDGVDELVPVGKAYSGFTNTELVEIDRWVRANGKERFGPVRAVEVGLVFEVAFDAVHISSRHKSGLAMRFPRIHRIRWDKPAQDADRVESLLELV